MKIVCIGRNYREHAQELGNAVPSEPVFFLKPSTAVLPPGQSFRMPSWTNSIHYELELVLRISSTCRAMPAGQLRMHVDGIGLGLDLTARDVQDELKKKGLPWEKAKAFDGSAVLGNGFLPLPNDLDNLSFSLLRNGTTVQEGHASEMIFPPDALLAHVSRYITLEPGDLLFTGTPSGVGPILPGDHFTGLLGATSLLELHVEP
jgi:acylpyruvate hydrolase